VLELGCADAFVPFDDAGIAASVAGPRGHGPVRLGDHRVAADVDVVRLAMHVGARGPVFLDRLPDLAGPAERHADRPVQKNSWSGLSDMDRRSSAHR